MNIADALMLAQKMGVETNAEEVRRLIELPDDLHRARFASQEYYDFFLVLKGKKELPTISTIEVSEDSVFKAAAQITEEGLKARYHISSVGLVPIAAITPEQAKEDLIALIKLNEATDKMQSTSAWLLGDMINTIRNIQPLETLDLSDFTDPSGKAMNTLITAASVAAAFPVTIRSSNLTFSHYKELFYQKGLSPEQKTALLEIAEKNNLGTKEARKLGSVVKRSENKDATIHALQTSPDAVTTALHVERRYNYYFLDSGTIQPMSLEDSQTPENGDLRCKAVIEQLVDGEWKTIRHGNAEAPAEESEPAL
jgi:hypothetical protein